MTEDALPAAAVDTNAVAGSLAMHWHVEADRIRYFPKGAGSHWLATVDKVPTWLITVDDLDAKPWIGGTRAATAEGLEAAYEAARALHKDCGLDFVVGPLRNTNGSTTVRLSSRYTMAVFPFVEGRTGSWGDRLGTSDRDALVRVLARLHQAILPANVRIARRPLDLPERPFLIEALRSLDRPWSGGALSEAARRSLSVREENVQVWLEQFDDLARQVGQLDDVIVTTHGEPHPGNIIHGAGGHSLIDWDTLALGRPERDLWMIDDGSSNRFALYEDLTGSRICEVAIRYYRLAWALSDIASFSEMFRMPHQDTKWIREKFRGFEQLLDGVSPAPWARSGTQQSQILPER